MRLGTRLFHIFRENQYIESRRSYGLAWMAEELPEGSIVLCPPEHRLSRKYWIHVEPLSLNPVAEEDITPELKAWCLLLNLTGDSG